MPGISLIAAPQIDMANLDTIAADMRHGDHINTVTLYRDDIVLILFSGYDGYPKWLWDHDGVVIVFEGMIYDASEAKIREKLHKIALDFKSGTDVTDSIREFINNSDGDFLVCLYVKDTHSVLLFNDKYGRLPCQYYQDERWLIVSREPTFLLNTVPSLEVDRIGLAEFFTWEFTLGTRTLFKDIYRFSTVACDLREGHARRKQSDCGTSHHTAAAIRFLKRRPRGAGIILSGHTSFSLMPRKGGMLYAVTVVLP